MGVHQRSILANLSLLYHERNFSFNKFKSTLVCLVLALSVQCAVLPRNNGGDTKEVEYKPVYKTEYKTKAETPKPEVKYETKVEYKTKTPAPVTKYETRQSRPTQST